MRFVVKMLRAAVLLASVSLLMSAAGWAQSEEQQSLGDAARKERAKKKSKVLTNEDLSQGSTASGSESASPEKSSEEKGEAAAKEGEEKAAVQGQEAPATAAEEADQAKKELESLQHDQASFEKGIARLEDMVANETDSDRRQLYANALSHARDNLETTKKKRAEAEKLAAEKEAAAKEAQKNQPQEQPPQ